MLLADIQENITNGRKMFALLVDPDKQSEADLLRLTEKINSPDGPDIVLVGGSLLFSNIDATVATLKRNTQKPVVLFPGSAMQVTNKADGILLLSLISGRNPDFLIGQHVLAAPALAQSGIEILPTGYMLIGEENYTSVRYISNTMPIPYNKTDIAVATALAGQMLGLKALYLEGGSGAAKPVSAEMIASVRRAVGLPLIVGGGLRSAADVEKALQAGADIVVVGTSIESNYALVEEIARTVAGFGK
ncbi:MAG: geranylgeranylglyceryl/heptaprenylglyceryl phosphate synthase [Salinivirgaceae bacterium]|nr:geranylgeranylglyceryl/heptaprenylglyceryl phosphate synthase [Salinivirgaceae bacterium]